MSCCKANWCKDFAIVHIDHKDQEYCVFHAPADWKGETLQSFNKLFSDLIQTLKSTDKPWDLSGIEFCVFR